MLILGCGAFARALFWQVSLCGVNFLQFAECKKLIAEPQLSLFSQKGQSQTVRNCQNHQRVPPFVKMHLKCFFREPRCEALRHSRAAILVEMTGCACALLRKCIFLPLAPCETLITPLPG